MTKILKGEPTKGAYVDRQQTIENIREIAIKFKETASLNLVTGNLLESDYHERAFQNAVNAFGFLSIVREAQQKIINTIE
jgi:hypothetical protein